MIVYFDSTLRTRGGMVPFWDSVVIDNEYEDKELVWFHGRYGRLNLYRLHTIPEENSAIAEDTGCTLWTRFETAERVNKWLEEPRVALYEWEQERKANGDHE